MYVYSAERQEGGRDLPGDEEPLVYFGSDTSCDRTAKLKVKLS